MSDTIQASDGTQVPLSSCPATINYSGSFVSTIVVTYQGKTFTQTFYNNGTVITGFSNWVES